MIKKILILWATLGLIVFNVNAQTDINGADSVRILINEVVVMKFDNTLKSSGQIKDFYYYVNIDTPNAVAQDSIDIFSNGLKATVELDSIIIRALTQNLTILFRTTDKYHNGKSIFDTLITATQDSSGWWSDTETIFIDSTIESNRILYFPRPTDAVEAMQIQLWGTYTKP